MGAATLLLGLWAAGTGSGFPIPVHSSNLLTEGCVPQVPSGGLKSSAPPAAARGRGHVW